MIDGVIMLVKLVELYITQPHLLTAHSFTSLSASVLSHSSVQIILYFHLPNPLKTVSVREQRV